MSNPSVTGADSLHSLYASHHGWLLDRLRRKLGNTSDAADLTQDTFIRAFVAGGIENIREPRAWLTTIARNLLLARYRRRSLEQAYLDALATLPEPVAPSPEHQALVIEAINEIDAMLDGLPTRVRDAFLLAQLEGLTYVQISEQLGVCERSVKRYVAQAFAHCILLAP
ncbi:MAG TPA: sigma-70 family RNA polymerase sigma factor [Povalibacter sp.]|uniref:sigma-70 family RNA polymerase sigma factor n=1 Tax=Povalibacter sp. TaxID=1962978 RepID=UPI002C8C67F3|nr:sigma-70 family RNA polymerase sigma factor [Povalibacter sp.]HMN43782.1 sigma-70 family RNA polymerase sigma factor [Povalibacter sp.]